MGENKFTHGPWGVTKYGYEKYSINGTNMVEICSCWNINNANLIAAAPELLEALERIIADIDDDSESVGSLYSVQHAREVIAKAKRE